VFDEVLRGLVAGKRVEARDRVAIAGHRVALTDQEAHARDAMIGILQEAGLAPPDATALAARIGLPPEVVSRIAGLLVRRGVLARTGDLLFHESALTRLKSEIQSLKRTGTLEAIDVATFKERYNLTRKHAIPLLEFLDRERVTRRVGGTRRIL
jgi:selenocysteine-specific elongation factor